MFPTKRRCKRTVDTLNNTLTPLSTITAKDPTRTVVTDSDISTGTKFGPFPGRDAVQTEFSDWMQFVTGVQNLNEANLVIFIYEKQLYFYCIRRIHPGMELFVWAGTKKNHLLESEWLSREIERAEHIFNFLCQSCDAIFSNHGGLFTHWSIVHCTSEFKIPKLQCKCQYCPRIIKNRSYLRTHVLRHLGIRSESAPRLSEKDGPFICNICGIGFRRNAFLGNHKRKHRHGLEENEKLKNKNDDVVTSPEEKFVATSDDRPIICEICGMSFKLNAHFGNHKKHKHGIKEDDDSN